ncbi:hypothetical protein L1049_019181 [Liquidambar formosana]|uniref:Uncharacterized protein n=1 Tax=Liquidambar formosana TaxID=63359 RepID=A0AAP0RC33_LIQFO
MKAVNEALESYLLSEAELLSLRPRSMSISIHKVDIDWHIYYDEENGLMLHLHLCSKVVQQGLTENIQNWRLRVSSSGRGRYTSGRGGFRSDSFRGHGNFGGGRGYSRNEFRNQGEFSGRPRGPTGRSGDTYQWVKQNGSGRGGRQGGMNRSSVPA